MHILGVFLLTCFLKTATAHCLSNGFSLIFPRASTPAKVGPVLQKNYRWTCLMATFLFCLNFLSVDVDIVWLNCVELQQCSGAYRITPVDVNSRPSSCLTNFLLTGSYQLQVTT